MGWTHDYRDVARDHRSSAVAVGTQGRTSSDFPETSTTLSHPLGIPHIIRRRARWVTARLRHTRT